MVHYYLAYGYIQIGMYDKAFKEIQLVLENTGRKNAGLLSALAIIQAYRGETKEVERVIEELLELEKEKYLSSFWLSMLYFVLGRNDEGFERMDMGYNAHDTLMIFLRADPLFDSIRSDPRYKEMIRKLNLE